MQKTGFALFAFMFLLSVIFVSSQVQAAQISEKVLEDLESNDQTRVLIVLESGISKTEFFNLANSVDSENKDVFFPYVISAELAKSEIISLAKDNRISRIELDYQFEANLQDSVGIVGAVDSWEKNVNSIPLDGTGETVCVVDTGIDFTHPDISSKNVLGCNLDCVYGDSEGHCNYNCTETDLNGHGTHVAGIAGASGGITGIGRGVNLIGAKVFEGNSSSSGSIVPMLRAMDWCTKNSDDYNISVISMSIGTDGTFTDYCDYFSPITSQIVNAAVAKNISVVVSSGNGGSNTGISLPACMQNAIAVSATFKNDDVWSGSNYNALVKLFAPGVGINSTTIGPNRYSIRTGTSASTPMVSASIAILNQYMDSLSLPVWEPKDFENLLYENGNQFTIDGYNFTRLNVNDALLSIDYLVPEVSLVSPVDDSRIISRNPPINVEFVCNTADWQLSELTLKVFDEFGNLVFTETKSVEGIFSEGHFFVDLGIGTYDWHCESVDTKGNEGVSQSYNLTISRFGTSGSLNRLVPWNITKYP